MANIQRPTPFTPARVGCWLLAAVAIYGVSAIRSRGALAPLLGQPAFPSLAAPWQLHLDYSTAAFAVLVFNVIALSTFLPPKWRYRAQFSFLALVSSATAAHLWLISRGLPFVGVHADLRSTILVQCVSLLSLAILWLLHFRLRRTPAFLPHLGFAFLLTAYITTLSFPSIVSLGF